jgi:isoleucyl-tRNA synthetase
LRAHRASTHVLDRWILARLDEVVRSVTDAFERYELDVAARPIADFIDDLSTWYLRRSRDRFKSEDAGAVRATMRFVLRELAKVMAPFTPFFAEHLFRAVRESGEPESVHLANWPEARTPESGVLAAMASARRIVAVGLEARAKAGVKVRQPLASMETAATVPTEYVLLILDELNVKRVILGASADGLDTALTPELVEEGVVRDIVRFVQDARKEAGFSPKDRMVLTVGADPLGGALVQKHAAHLASAVLASSVTVVPLEGEPVRIGDYAFTFSLRR